MSDEKRRAERGRGRGRREESTLKPMRRIVGFGQVGVGVGVVPTKYPCMFGWIRMVWKHRGGGVLWTGVGHVGQKRRTGGGRGRGRRGQTTRNPKRRIVGTRQVRGGAVSNMHPRMISWIRMVSK